MTTSVTLTSTKTSRSVSAIAMNTNNKWSRLFGLSALAVALNACQSIPSAETNAPVARPNIPLGANSGYDYVDPNQAPSSLAALRWQSFYTDPKLKSLIQMGLENNKDVRQAVLAIQRAEAQYRISDKQDLPRVNANGEYSRSSRGGYDNGDNSFEVGLGMASYELDFWGRISSLKEQALQDYLATTAAKDTAQVSLIANIARSYVDLSYQLKQLELALSTLQTREESLRITLARLEAGIDSKAPSLQAAAAVEQARIAALEAQSNVLTARNALKFLIGTPITDDMLPEPAVSSIVTEDVLNAGLPSDLLRYRPDVLQAEYKLKAAGANIEVARTAYYPTISLTGNLGYSSTDLSDLFKSSSAGWSFGPSVSLPIFDAGRRDADYEVAQIEREQALASYENAIESAFREVNDVLATRATLDERRAAEYRLQENYQGIYEVSDARYKAQVDDYLAVLDAQRSLFSTQQSILRLEQERLNNQIELYQALGGGANLVEPKSIPTPQHRNLSNILQVSTNEQKAEDAIKAASAPTIATARQAAAIEAGEPLRVTEQTVTDTVDLDNDNNPDAYISQIETTTHPAGSTINKTEDGYEVVAPDNGQ